MNYKKELAEYLKKENPTSLKCFIIIEISPAINAISMPINTIKIKIASGFKSIVITDKNIPKNTIKNNTTAILGSNFFCICISP